MDKKYVMSRDNGFATDAPHAFAILVQWQWVDWLKFEARLKSRKKRAPAPMTCFDIHSLTSLRWRYEKKLTRNENLSIDLHDGENECATIERPARHVCLMFRVFAAIRLAVDDLYFNEAIGLPGLKSAESEIRRQIIRAGVGAAVRP